MASQERPPWAEVALSVYELHGTSALNGLTTMAGLGGAYHVGVEVYWLEWSFGWCEEGSGVYMVHIGQSTLGRFKERVPLGRTPHSPEKVMKILQGMRNAYLGSSYDLLQRNCAHFSVDFVKRLGVEEAPAWVNSLAGVGDQLIGRLGARAAREAADAATPAERVPPTAAHFDDDELEEEAYEGNDLAMRELVWRKAQDFVQEKAKAARRRLRVHDIQFEFQWGAVPGVADAAYLAPTTALLLRQGHFRHSFASAVASALGVAGNAEDSDVGEDEEDSRDRLEILALSPLPGRCVCARLRVNGNAHDEVWPPEMRAAPDFRRVLEERMWALATSRAASSWPAYAADLVAGIQVMASPGQASFGQRVETHAGPGGAVIHARAEAPGGGALTGTMARLQRLQGLRQSQRLNYGAAKWAYAGGGATQAGYGMGTPLSQRW